ncbi:MAG: UDP-N-acetylmuramate dehydrogenase [Oligoflexus sp.]
MTSSPLLKDLAYYRTGGLYQKLHRPESVEELADSMREITAKQAPYFVLGAGSNSLVMDETWPGHVIVFDRLSRLKLEGNQIYAEAGVENSALSQFAFKHGLGDLSWMNRLPGQLGGTVRMNARCYGGEISQVVGEVQVVSPDGQVKLYQNQPEQRHLFRGYKDTIFMENQEIIVSAKFYLESGDQQKLKAWMDHCEQDRTSKGQFTFPSCGCVFKNNYAVGVPSGMLLDRAGVHQLSDMAVEINPMHANFVFNKQASSRQILEMTFAMRELVYAKFGVWLEYEMEILGQVPQDLLVKLQEKRPAKFVESALEELRLEFRGRQST